MRLMIPAVLCAAVAVMSGSPALCADHPEKILPLSQVDALPYGTPLYGVSTLDPSGPKKFSARLLGVLHNASDTIGPGHSWIAVALDPDTNPSVVAGQSGSPVYTLKHEKIGTISYADLWVKNPIGYLTPIEEVLAVSPSGGNTPSPHGAPLDHLMSSLLPDTDPLRVMMANGATSGVTSPGVSTPVKAGSVLGVQLAWGDFDMTAYGTVSHIDGKNIYMFGHPFLQLGPAEYRLIPAKVLAVQWRYDHSYIVAVPVANAKPLGTITQDQATAISGVLGKEPEHTIPVTITLHPSQGLPREFHFQTVSDSALAPRLASVGLMSAIGAWSRDMGDRTLFVTGKIEVVDSDDIEFNEAFLQPEETDNAGRPKNKCDNQDNPCNPFFLLSHKMETVLNNRFAPATIKQITVEVRVFDEYRRLSVEAAVVDQPTVNPGDTLQLRVTLTQPSHEAKTIVLPISLPSDLQYGAGRIVVGDHDAVQQVEKAATAGSVVNLAGLITSLNEKRRPDAVYVYVVFPPSRPEPTKQLSASLKVDGLSAEVTRTSKSLTSNVEEYQILVNGFQVVGNKEVQFTVGTSAPSPAVPKS